MVSVTAEDADDKIVTHFTGTTGLSGVLGWLQATNVILGNITHQFQAPVTGPIGYQTRGYSFTPNTDLTVTHARSYSGSKVSIWTDTGILIATQTVSSVAGTWVETPFASPVTLAAGTTYRVAVYSSSQPIYYRTDGSTNFAFGTINQSYNARGDSFPTLATSSARWYLVDLSYKVGPGWTVAVSPTNSGNFISGVWTGSVAVLEAATNVTLAAGDGAGHSGTSTQFDVQAFADLAATLTDAPDPIMAGNNLTYSITITNSGPDKAARVVLIDPLPIGAAFVSATSSQGTCTQMAGIVTCNLGALSNAADATATIVVQPTVANVLSNTVTVTSCAADSNLADNVASTITTVQGIGVLAVGSGTNVCHDIAGNSSSGQSFGTVTAGSTYPYAVSGTVALNLDGCYSDPNGNIVAGPCAPQTNSPAGFVCPGLKSWSLVGKINGGSCIQLGSGGSFITSESGGLVLYFNDNEYGDNSGSWNACLTAPSDLSSTGPVGGPFSPASQVYSLTNSGTAGLDWSISVTQNWLSFSAISGVLAAGASTNITALINTNANGLGAGNYSDSITFTNTTNGIGSTTRPVTLAVMAPANLAATPSSGLSSTGIQWGPFSPSSQDYTLTNTGSVSLDWSANKNANWVTVSANSGTLRRAVLDWLRSRSMSTQTRLMPAVILTVSLLPTPPTAMARRHAPSLSRYWHRPILRSRRRTD